MSAVRNVQPLGAVPYNSSAIVIMGVELSSLNGDNQWFHDMDELAGKGNRVIIGLVPRRNRFIQPEVDPQANALKPWAVRLAFVRQSDFRDDEDERLVAGWPMYFAESKGWSSTRAESGRSVVIERAQGKGSIVLMANPYPLTNAAMVDDRQTVFLLSLIGPLHQAVFDETHFGFEETGSIAALARRYRLQGLLLGLAITAALFIWKSLSWGGPEAARSQSQSVKGEDSAETFRNLLRRNVKTEDILSTCVQAWSRMYHRKAGPGLAAAIDLAENGRQTPARTYAQIQTLLGAKANQS
jgi:hypothetical protein